MCNTLDFRSTTEASLHEGGGAFELRETQRRRRALCSVRRWARAQSAERHAPNARWQAGNKRAGTLWADF